MLTINEFLVKKHVKNVQETIPFELLSKCKNGTMINLQYKFNNLIWEHIGTIESIGISKSIISITYKYVIKTNSEEIIYNSLFNFIINDIKDTLIVKYANEEECNLLNEIENYIDSLNFTIRDSGKVIGHLDKNKNIYF